jgi:tripartite-type tricarboxylate transporter receptor subunit TctC
VSGKYRCKPGRIAEVRAPDHIFRQTQGRRYQHLPEKRAVNYPDLPTFAESGFPKLKAMSWFGLSAPANLPQPIVDRLNIEVRHALNKPDVRERFANEGIETSSMDAAVFTKFVKSEIDFWTPYVKGLKTEK